MQPRFSTAIVANRRWLGVCGLLAVTLSAISLSGLPGLLVGGLLAVSWTRLPPEYTFALGQFAMAMLLPDVPVLGSGFEVSQTLLVSGELGLVALLVAPHGAGNRDRPVAGVAIAMPVSAILLSVFAGWMSVAWLDSIWVAIVGGASLATLIAIGLYEYESWILDPPPQEQSAEYE